MSESDDELLHHRSDQGIQSIRTVLMGTTVLMSFQFSSFFVSDFSKLGRSIREVHLADLVFVISAVIIMSALISYRLLKEQGRDTPSFLKFTSICILAGEFLVLVAISGDTYDVARITVPEDADSPAAIGLGLFIFLVGISFGLDYGQVRPYWHEKCRCLMDFSAALSSH